MKIKKFATNHNIGLKLYLIPFRKDLGHTESQWEKDARHYAFILSYDNKTYKGYFSQGSGIKSKPRVDDILNALLMDTLDVNEPFSLWCLNYGYDEDSINAHKIYSLCQEEYNGLLHLLGTEILSELWACDQL